MISQKYELEDTRAGIALARVSMQKNKQSFRFGIGVTNLLIVKFVNIVGAKDLSNSNVNMKKTTLIKAFWSTNYEWNKNTALYGIINTPMHLLLFNGDCMISSQIFLSITRELHISHCYKQFMNKIKFEHRSGALPFTSFLSVCAPVLCSNNNKGDVYDR